MKTKILASLLAIVSMLVIVAMPCMPTASADEGTETIDEDYYWYQTAVFFYGDYLTLSYTIDVLNDIYIDVMLLNEENFNKYINDQTFEYYRDGTDFNTLYKNVPSITLTDHDNYYIVVDNTDDPPGGAEPAWDGVNNYCTFHYTTTVEAGFYDTGGDGGNTVTIYDDDEGLTMEGLLCGIVMLGVIVIIIIVVVALLKKKGRTQQSYEQLHQSYQPPQQPYQQPQQPYQQPPQDPPYYRDEQRKNP